MNANIERLGGSCGACGTRYRTPAWPREYVCGACGEPLLGTQPPAARKKLPLGYVAAALGLAGLAAVPLLLPSRRTAPGSSSTPQPSAPSVARPMALPEGMRERLLEKARYLEADSRRQPENPEIQERLGSVFLSLAVLEREGNPSEARRWQERALKCVQRLRAQGRTSNLEGLVLNWQNLVWRVPRTRADMRLPSFSPSAPFSSPGPAYGAPPGGAPPVPAPLPGAPAAGVPSMGGLPSPTSAPGIPSGVRATPPGGPPAATSLPAPGPDLAVLRAAVAADPANALAADELGIELERQAEVARGRYSRDVLRGRRAAEPFLREALAVYLRAEREVPLHLHRTTFLVAAAQVYQRLGDPEAEYATLQRALRYSPWSQTVWQRLEAACLRLGRPHESRQARKSAELWTFPEASWPGPDAAP